MMTVRKEVAMMMLMAMVAIITLMLTKMVMMLTMMMLTREVEPNQSTAGLPVQPLTQRPANSHKYRSLLQQHHHRHHC